ncbi:Uncharacterised protein [Haemophilus paraphrohaemolyticus]|uniref:Uncharacterized protein n=1 Tax=Haemophilus paraphrohaemolyticus HK411 TaxID=1095743 RepID=I2ND68_9PAST|nr:hypothetical protein HMPREF1054_0702 [Haemophilus paraphrohaemolyticus HK411]STP01625.1 Uncharacterised protein [Haemophilus paraphrohaemolyticus]
MHLQHCIDRMDKRVDAGTASTIAQVENPQASKPGASG